jgi:hypothetical protein
MGTQSLVGVIIAYGGIRIQWSILEPANDYLHAFGSPSSLLYSRVNSIKVRLSVLLPTTRLIMYLTSYFSLVLCLLFCPFIANAIPIAKRDDNLPARVPYVFPPPGTNEVS